MDNENMNFQNVVIARRSDGLGPRIVSLLCARLFAESIGGKLRLVWPDIAYPYFSENILKSSSLNEIFSNSRVFTDIDLDIVDQETHAHIHKENSISLSHFLQSKGMQVYQPGSHKLLIDSESINEILQYQYILYDFPSMLEWKEEQNKNNLEQIKDYWKHLNWHENVLSKFNEIASIFDIRQSLVIHLRRGDVLQTFLHQKLDIIDKEITALVQRFLPLKTAYNVAFNYQLDNVIICSENPEIALEFKNLLPSKNILLTFNYFPTNENQQAALDLLIMSKSKELISSPVSYFAGCAAFGGETNLINCPFDWDNIYSEVSDALDKSDVIDKEDRKSLLCIRIAGVFKYQPEKMNFYNELAKKHSLTIFNKFSNEHNLAKLIKKEKIMTENNSVNNLALNKPTAQSSIYDSFTYDPQGACNGQKTGGYGFHTLKENQPWWQIDLQDIYQISEIVIYNRINHGERSSSLNILFSNDALYWQVSYSNVENNLFGGIDGNPLLVKFDFMVGRYIRLQLRNNEYFHLDEIEIYGTRVVTKDLESKAECDESSLSANFYSQACFPTPPDMIQKSIMNVLEKLSVYDTDLGKVRVGNLGDGGYVIPNDLTDIKGIVSIGIGREVSFDMHFAQIGIKVYQYDHTIESPPILHDNCVFRKLGWGPEDSSNLITLSTIIQHNSLGDDDLILKFDVENAEWDALYDVSPELLKRFRIITCELHGFDQLEDSSFLKKVNRIIDLLTANHTVIHIHPNNCCGVALVAGITLPRLIEFSFLRNDRASFYPSHQSIPSDLDYPNVQRLPEIVLTPFNFARKNTQKINLALNKPTAQSSIYPGSTYDPQGACNGQKTGGFGFHTLKEQSPWWQIDLQDMYMISEISIYNRINCSDRASTLNILLSNDAANWRLCYSNDKNNVFGGIDHNPLIVNISNLARYVRLQLRENEYFHLDEVEIYGIPLTKKLIEQVFDEVILSENFYSEASSPPPPPPPREIPTEMITDFTINNQIPVIDSYYNNTLSTPILIRMEDYDYAFKKLETSSFEYYGNTLDYLLCALDKYSLVNKSVLIFGLVGVNCDAISLWKGAKDIYVVDYNLPISEHPKVKVFSYEDYINNGIQADVGISISSFEHDGLGRYGDPINPNGDLEAMKLSKKLIKKEGLLFFSVPVGKDCIAWNAHRIYGKIRLPMILEGWEELDSFGYSDSLTVDQDLGIYQQPVFVLKNL